MNKVLTIILLVLLPVIASAASLEGTWKSDEEKTLFWNSEYQKVSDEHLLKLSYILGHHYLTYEAGKSCSYFETFAIKGKINEAHALPESSYTVAAKNDHGVVVEETLSTGEKVIYMIVFESNDSFYGVMLDAENFGQPGHREYYKRVNSIGIITWGSSSCYPQKIT